MKSKDSLKINDISKNREKLTSVDPENLMPLPGEFDEDPWEESPEETRKKYFKAGENPYYTRSIDDGKLQSKFKLLDFVDIAIGILLSGIVFIFLKSSYIAAGVVAAFFGIIIGMIDLLIRGRNPVLVKVFLFLVSGMILYIYGYYFF